MEIMKDSLDETLVLPGETAVENGDLVAFGAHERSGLIGLVVLNHGKRLRLQLSHGMPPYPLTSKIGRRASIWPGDGKIYKSGEKPPFQNV
jgi:hypothetical protein